MIIKQSNHDTLGWTKYLLMALICGLVAVDGMNSALADSGKSADQSVVADKNKHNGGDEENSGMVMKSDTVAARPGG